MSSPAEVLKAINDYEKFVVTTHRSPEADAVGSAMALCDLLKRTGKQAVVVMYDKVPSALDYFPDLDKIVYSQSLENMEFDMLCVVDCGDLERTGLVPDDSKSEFKKKHKILNIDHHISNDDFGHVNWVDPKASSATILVYQLYTHMKLKLNKDMADVIYSSLLTETGCFTYSNTNEQCLKVASELVGIGTKTGEISDRLFNSLPIGRIKLVGEVVKDIKTNRKQNIAWVVVRKALYEKTGTTAEDTDGIVNYTVSIKGVKVGILIREIEEDALFKISLRSKGSVDVAKLAGTMGGGGHKQAAGCTLTGKCDEVVASITALVEGACQ